MSDGSDRIDTSGCPEETPLGGAEDGRAESRDPSEAARRAAESAAGRVLDGTDPTQDPTDPASGAPVDEAAVDPSELSEGARRIWTEHLFVHGLLVGLNEIESNADVREARVDALMMRVRRVRVRVRRPWLHYAAAAAVIVFLVIGGLQLLQRDAPPDTSPLELAIEGLAEDVDLEYVGDIAFERSDRPLESFESTFITGPDRFYVKTHFPNPFGQGQLPFEFGAFRGRRWINMMGFPIDLAEMERRMGGRGFGGMGPMSNMGMMDSMRLLTDLGALLRKIRETCDVDLSDGGKADDGESLVRLRGRPRDPDDVRGLASIEVLVGRRSSVVKSFTIVCVPPKPTFDEPKPGTGDRRSRFRERMFRRKMKEFRSLQHVTISYRLVRAFRAPRDVFLPEGLGAASDDDEDAPERNDEEQKR